MEIKRRLAVLAVLVLLLILVVLLSIGAAARLPATPTISVRAVQTSAIATFSAGMTQTAAALPTRTATASLQPTSTEANLPQVSPTPSCYRLRFLRDLTIPDYVAMKPGQAFIKSWLVQNNGTCQWQSGFKFSLVGGVAMGTTSVNLIPSVAPGGRISISVTMTAPPDQTGTLVSTWRMADQDGNLFGDALTVIITIGGPGTSPTP